MNAHPADRILSLLVSFAVFVLVVAGLPSDAIAATAASSDIGSAGMERPVVEALRLKVPAHAKVAWVEAELGSWEPWLQRQSGFLGRQLLWDGEKQEGILLIHWRRRADWLAIPQEAIEAVQNQFEAQACQALGQARNPFPLVHAGELEPMGSSSTPLPGSR